MLVYADTRAHTDKAVGRRLRASGRRKAKGQSEGSKPSSWKLRPYERSRCDEHGGCLWHALRTVVPAPPGVVMVAPPEVPRNAEGGAKRRPRCRRTEVGNNATNNTSIIKARRPRRIPRPWQARTGQPGTLTAGFMQHAGYELPRIPIPRTPVNKGKR